ncbi:MAG: energy-coupling factor transporter transmembrane protein EcfT, partial [Clostridiales bacterium]|nr:energy-coupling factor transporter transmembrane protein EcfT [Clostridiales bacterium]
MDAMEQFQVKKPIYPLLCLASTLAFLIAGMLMAKREYFWIFLIEIIVFYIIFGYIKPVLGAVAVFIPVSLLFVLMAMLVNRDFSIALTTGGRVFLVGMCAVPSLGMPLIRLVRNLNQIRCPKMLTLGMLITVRFVPMVAAEVRQIREAMKTRGVRASLWNVKCFYRALLIPLVMRLINISDTMSLSLETRGFELEDTPVTIYEPVVFEARDGIFLALMAVL